MNHKSWAALALAASCAAVPAKAAVITFDELAHRGQHTLHSGITSGGFNFVNDGNGGVSSLGVWGEAAGAFAPGEYRMDPKGAALFHNFQLTTTTMTKAGGGTFTLNSIDLADVYNNRFFFDNNLFGGTVRLGFTTVSGTTTQDVLLDSLVGGETFTFNRADLTAFTIRVPNVGAATARGGFVQFDNVVVDRRIGAVPEPTSWALMIVGFAAVGAIMRRRNLKSAASRATA